MVAQIPDDRETSTRVANSRAAEATTGAGVKITAAEPRAGGKRAAAGAGGTEAVPQGLLGCRLVKNLKF